MNEKTKDCLISTLIFGFLFLFFAVSTFATWFRGYVAMQIVFGVIAIFFGIFAEINWLKFWKSWKKIKNK